MYDLTSVNLKWPYNEMDHTISTFTHLHDADMYLDCLGLQSTCRAIFSHLSKRKSARVETIIAIKAYEETVYNL